VSKLATKIVEIAKSNETGLAIYLIDHELPKVREDRRLDLIADVIKHAFWWQAEINRTRGGAISVALEDFELPLFRAMNDLLKHDLTTPVEERYWETATEKPFD